MCVYDRMILFTSRSHFDIRSYVCKSPAFRLISIGLCWTPSLIDNFMKLVTVQKVLQKHDRLIQDTICLGQFSGQLCTKCRYMNQKRINVALFFTQSSFYLCSRNQGLYFMRQLLQCISKIILLMDLKKND